MMWARPLVFPFPRFVRFVGWWRREDRFDWSQRWVR